MMIVPVVIFQWGNVIELLILSQVRRGADRAEIYSLAFSPTAQWLAVSSDKGTVHVFSLKVEPGTLGSEQSYNASEPVSSPSSMISSLSFMKGMYAHMNELWDLGVCKFFPFFFLSFLMIL